MAIKLDRISVSPAAAESIFPSFSSVWSSISQIGSAALNAISNIGSLFEQEEDFYCGIARLEIVKVGPLAKEEKDLELVTQKNTKANEKIPHENGPSSFMRFVTPVKKGIHFSETIHAVSFRKEDSPYTISEGRAQQLTTSLKSILKRKPSMSDVD